MPRKLPRKQLANMSRKELETEARKYKIKISQPRRGSSSNKRKTNKMLRTEIEAIRQRGKPNRNDTGLLAVSASDRRKAAAHLNDPSVKVYHISSSKTTRHGDTIMRIQLHTKKTVTRTRKT